MFVGGGSPRPSVKESHALLPKPKTALIDSRLKD